MNRLLHVITFLLSSSILAPALSRIDYRMVYGDFNDRIAWRAWTQPDGPRLLVVDPKTLEEAVVPGTEAELKPRPVSDTTWDRLRIAANLRRNGLQNAGIHRGNPLRAGAWLTFDLCPSNNPLDRQLFTDLEADAQPLPVFLEVSGRWMETHPADLDWLTAERNAGRLAITWVNHTEHHTYHPAQPLSENFLLIPGTNLQAEIFPVEQTLLDRGELPSVFFRFPGLISSPDLVDQILALGLIPLGSSAWLAKNQHVKTGAIVLTHPNGNEPFGLQKLETWDHGHKEELKDNQWHWLGLEDWVGGEPGPP